MNNKASNWICPNDRQLLLRSKLHIGWSVKAEQYEKYGTQPKPLSDDEKEIIESVIKRAENVERQEQERIGKLVARVDNMKKSVFDSNTNMCSLCGAVFRFFGNSSKLCSYCQRLTCCKCAVQDKSGKSKDVWFCKICIETREVWKKSGAWFYKSIPKYIDPDCRKLTNNLSESCSNISSRGSDVTDDYEVCRSDDDNNNFDYSPMNETKSKLSSCISNYPDIDACSLQSLELEGRRNSNKASNLELSKLPNCEVEVRIGSFDSESGFSSSNQDKESDVASISSGFSSQLTTTADIHPEYYPTSQRAKSFMGTLDLSIRYDSDGNSLDIFLHSAKDLNATSINNDADPFCKLNLVPSGAKSYRLRTKTVRKTRHPEFNETVTFYGITDEDLQTQFLHILMLDEDKYGCECLGEIRLPLSIIKPGVTKNMRLNLENLHSDEVEDDIWGDTCGSIGQIGLRLSYSTKRRSMLVKITRCTNLIPMDANGLSDPFVKLWLKSPDEVSHIYKTSVKWKTLNPVFNEEFAIPCKLTDLARKTLVITVWDKDPGRSNDFQGSLELGCHSKSDRLRQWLDVIKYPDHNHEAVHNLSSDLITP